MKNKAKKRKAETQLNCETCPLVKFLTERIAEQKKLLQDYCRPEKILIENPNLN